MGQEEMQGRSLAGQESRLQVLSNVGEGLLEWRWEILYLGGLDFVEFGVWISPILNFLAMTCKSVNS